MADLALVTTLNEAGTIYDLVLDLRALGLDVLVIDAGSADGTAGLARAAGAAVSDLPGASIRDGLLAGWRLALKVPDYRALVQIDAGGSHDPRQALDLLRALDGAADMVIGSRFLPGSRYLGRPWRRRLSRAAALACQAKTGARLTDWTSGYRAFSAKALLEMAAGAYRATMHGWQIEVVGRALDQGLRVVEVPISYTAGRSSFNRQIAREAGAAWIRL